MVTRKPVPPAATLDPAVPQHAREGWSTGSGEDNTIWQDGAQHQYGPPPANASSSFSDLGDGSNVWAEGAPTLANTTEDMSQVPVVLRPGSSHGTGAGAGASDPVPAAVRLGGDHFPETNPFKRLMSAGTGGGQSKSPGPAHAPPVLSGPVPEFTHLSVNEPNSNPWGPADVAGSLAPRIPEQESVGDNVWASANPSPQPTPGPGSHSPAVLSLPSEDGSAGWEEEPAKPVLRAPLDTSVSQGALEDSHAWDDLGLFDKGKAPAQLPPVPKKDAAGTDDWNLIDMEAPAPLSKQSTWENFGEGGGPAKPVEGASASEAEVPPSLPPRRSDSAGPASAPPQPPRPVDKSERYQIKNISWHDHSAAHNPRISPILVQNANGPCPLVALVNALTLTTPPDKPTTALVETLKSREQISLRLLLDAVFDELMSERRAPPEATLPDVTELYGFLTGLHTGMNVNPRFIPEPEVVAAMEHMPLTHLHPSERVDVIPGTFERTKEMSLYSIFSIPLIHGWLPSRDDAAYGAFKRQAASYEDCQNLLFREEELEEKLRSHEEGLTPDEQQILQDVLVIKAFLNRSATQLTQFGLDLITKAMKPGSIAILFRNDHFSTLYRHPKTLELLTLVTDAGYASLGAVVWESLVDVTGESTEFFAGDFRLAGDAVPNQAPPQHNDTARSHVPDHWADTLNDGGVGPSTPPRRGRTHTSRQGGPSDAHSPPLSPNHEQEDRDLALALQLQEEEDERARAARERRRRESLLSEQFIEQQGHSTRPTTTSNSNSSNTTPRPRGASHSTTSLTSSATNTSATARQPRAAVSASNTPRPAAAGRNTQPQPQTQTVRSLIPPATAPRTTNRPAEDGLDDAPPSYEQAAKQLPYLPPAGHPSHASSSQAQLQQQQQNGGRGQGNGRGQVASNSRGGRRGGGVQQQQQQQPPQQPQQQGVTGRRRSDQGPVPVGGYPAGGGYRRGVPVQGGQQGSGEGDGRCVVM